MNKKAIQYDNNLRWEANKPQRKPYRQTQRSLQRSQDMREQYDKKPKHLILGLDHVTHSKSPNKDLENKPSWNDRTVVQKDLTKDKLDARFIRSDYGKQYPPKQQSKDSQIKMKLIHQSQKQLEKLKEVVQTENMIKTAQVSKKNQQELNQLQLQMDLEQKQNKDYNKFLSEKYEKIQEQKNLNNYLEEQIRVIKSHKRDLRKAQSHAGEENSRSRSFERKKSPSQEKRGISSENWNQKLTNMKSKADDNQQKLAFRNNFFQQEIEEEQQSGLDVYPTREYESDSRRSQSRNRSYESSPGRNNRSIQQQRIFLQQKQKENEHYDKMIEISQQEAWKQYEIHQAIKQNRREKMIESQHYNNVERALQNLEDKVEPLRQKAEQLKKNSVFSGNLIGRATTKLIKVNHQKIIELLIDDLLYEMVGILSKEEQAKTNKCEKMTRECLVNDYLDEFREMAYEQCDIVDKMKEVELKNQEFVNFRHTTPHEQAAFNIHPTTILLENVRIELSLGIMVNILDKKSEYVRKLQKFDHNTKKNMNAFSKITEDLLDELILNTAKELDDANGKYAEMMFKHEFK